MAARRTLDLETHRKVVELHERLGERQARRVLGNLSPEAYARALARLTQQAATIEVIKARIEAWKGAA